MNKIVKAEKTKELVTTELRKLQELAKNPTTIGVLEFLTGIGATAIDKPASLILSGGRLTQALFKGKFYQQLYSEVHSYRKIGEITDENLNSNYGRTIFADLMRAIDEENLDDEKFEAFKSIFSNSVRKGTNEHSQLLAYQYFQVCKKLNSIDILILKTAFEIYEGPGSNQRSQGISEWELTISKKLGIPQELISQSRLANSPIRQTPNTIIFDAEKQDNKHGLTTLGIAIGEFIKNDVT